MTSESEGSHEGSGRRFDDIASLFGSIVPPPGSVVRPSRRMQPLPTELPDPATVPPAPPVVPSPVMPPAPVIGPRALPTGLVPSPAPPAALLDELPDAPGDAAPVVDKPLVTAPAAVVPLRPGPSFTSRPRPTEIPWPDAFEPRPNYRKREMRNWSWLLLVPVGIVVAYGVSVADVRAIKSWVDLRLLGRPPALGTVSSPVLPAPFRTGPSSSGVPDTAPPTSSAPAPAPVSTPAPADAEAAAPEPIPYPEIPTSPLPVPPGTEASPPPADPAQAVAAPSIHITIQYRRNIPGAEGEARRIAALLQNSGGSVELHPAAAAVRSPTITYYAPADKAAATALAATLSNEAANWTIRLGTGKATPGSLEIAMP